MVETEFDDPGPKEVECIGCHKPMMVTPYWSGRSWIYPTCHEECYYAVKVVRPKNVMPERFKVFDDDLFKDKEALAVADAFDLDSGFKTLAILGMPGHGKSRLMWHVLGRFFGEVEHRANKKRWVEYWLYPDLMTDWDRDELKKVKTCQFCFIDDIGITEGYGRERALLQDVIRARVQKGQWTFLTIDDPSFDPGFKDLFRQRAVEVYVE